MRLERVAQADALIGRGCQERPDVTRRIDHETPAVTDLDEVRRVAEALVDEGRDRDQSFLHEAGSGCASRSSAGFRRVSDHYSRSVEEPKPPPLATAPPARPGQPGEAGAAQAPTARGLSALWRPLERLALVRFVSQDRGEIEIKGKSRLRAYLLIVKGAASEGDS
jgi:hypothetical protein